MSHLVESTDQNGKEIERGSFQSGTHTSFFCGAAGIFLFGAAPLILPST